MRNSVKDFIFGDGNTMNPVFRQFAMGAVAMAVMQAASAQVSMTGIVPMQIPGQGTEIRVMFNGLPPQPQAYQLEQPSRLVLDFDKAQQNIKQPSIPVATNEASSVEVASDAQRSRLTVNLADAGAFTRGYAAADVGHRLRPDLVGYLLGLGRRGSFWLNNRSAIA